MDLYIYYLYVCMYIYTQDTSIDRYNIYALAPLYKQMRKVFEDPIMHSYLWTFSSISATEWFIMRQKHRVCVCMCVSLYSYIAIYIAMYDGHGALNKFFSSSNYIFRQIYFNVYTHPLCVCVCGPPRHSAYC